MVIFITLLASLIASASQLLYKTGLGRRINRLGHFLELVHSRRIIAGGIGYIASLVIYLYALSNAPLSVVYPVFASSFIFTTLLSARMLGERFSARRGAGVLLVFIGVVIIASSV